MRRAIAVLAAAALFQTPLAAAWTWPIEGPVLRPFVFGSDPYAAGQHRGIDIGAQPGTLVRAAAAGTVSFAGTVPAGGRTVSVRTTGGLSVTYLELGAIHVERGAEVAEGDPIGAIGAASHVHFGVRVTAEAQGYLDPLQFLPTRVSLPARAESLDVAPAEVRPQPVVVKADPVQPLTADEAAHKPKPEPEPVLAAPAAKLEPQSVPATSAQSAQAEPAPTHAATPTPVAAEPMPADSGSAVWPPPAAAERRRPVSEAVTASAPDRAKPPSQNATDAPADGASVPARDLVLGPSADVSESLPGTPVEARHRPDVTRRRPEASTAPVPPGTARTVEPHGKPVVVARPPGTENDPEHPSVKPAFLGGVLALGLLGAAATARRRRRSRVPPDALAAVDSMACPQGRTRPPTLIHACARAGELGWLARRTRPRYVRAPHGPLPRPRRRPLVGTR
jgi:hypothetical protein